MSIVWLASYPKSGNTWMRAFLVSYLADSAEPLAFEDFERIRSAASRALFEEYAGITSSDLSPQQSAALQPEVYRLLAAGSDSPCFLKVHDAYRTLPDGRPLFPDDATLGALYIVRNPLDVCVSMQAHFVDADIADSLARLQDKDLHLASNASHLTPQLSQYIGDWQDHVKSWTRTAKGFPVKVIRYEDMCRQPLEVFAQVLRFSGLDLDRKRLERAIDASSFSALRAQEEKQAFPERPAGMKRFFRRGGSGGWRGILSHAQVAEVENRCCELMQEFGYLQQSDCPRPRCAKTGIAERMPQ